MLRRCFVFALALFAVSLVSAAISAEEMVRIDRLIQFVEAQKDLKFVRNGSAYDGTEAAKFMRGKFEMMGERVNTAQSFIEHIATKSSTTGLPYHILFVDGKTVLAAKFLGDELKRMIQK